MNRTTLATLLLTCTIQSGCSMSASREIVILLPGQFRGDPIVLAETSASNISINEDLVPSLILRVWWSDKVIWTENHPMLARANYPDDDYMVPDRTSLCWYVMDLTSDTVRRFDREVDLHLHLESLGVDLSAARLMPLHEARRRREDELGFKFTATSINRYIREHQRRRAQFVHSEVATNIDVALVDDCRALADDTKASGKDVWTPNDPLPASIKMLNPQYVQVHKSSSATVVDIQLSGGFQHRGLLVVVRSDDGLYQPTKGRGWEIKKLADNVYEYRE